MRANLLKGHVGPRSATWYRDRLRSSRPGDRRDAALELGRLAVRGELSAETLRKWLAPVMDDSDMGVSLTAAVALVDVDALGETRRLRDRLRECFDRSVDSLLLTASVRTFLEVADEDLARSLRDAAVAAALEGAGSPRGEVAAWVLGEIAAAGEGTVVRTLVGMLSDPKVGNRAAAAWALGRSARPEAFDTLRAILLDGGNHALIDKALRGLGDADGPEMVDRMIDSLRYDAPPSVMSRLRGLPSRYRRRSTASAARS